MNQLDPLHPAPRDPDFAYERDIYYRAEEKRSTEEVQRLRGHRWESIEKLL